MSELDRLLDDDDFWDQAEKLADQTTSENKSECSKTAIQIKQINLDPSQREIRLSRKRRFSETDPCSSDSSAVINDRQHSDRKRSRVLPSFVSSSSSSSSSSTSSSLNKPVSSASAFGSSIQNNHDCQAITSITQVYETLRLNQPEQSTDDIAPKCKGHKLPSKRFCVRKEGVNKGRWFWVCQQMSQCKSFQWEDKLPAMERHRILKYMKSLAQSSVNLSVLSSDERKKISDQRNGHLLNRFDTMDGLIGQDLTINTELISWDPHPMVELTVHPLRKPIVDVICQSGKFEFLNKGKVFRVSLDSLDAITGALRKLASRKELRMNVKGRLVPKGIVSSIRKWMREELQLKTKLECRVHHESQSPKRLSSSSVSSTISWRIDSQDEISVDRCRDGQTVEITATPKGSSIVKNRRKVKPEQECINWCSTNPEFIKYLRQGFEGELHSLPLKLRSRMYEFQKDGFVFALSKHGRVLIADEMGLGKTIQAIAVAAHYRKDWPLLVVCPSSLCLNWKAELLKWLPISHSESEKKKRSFFSIHQSSDSTSDESDDSKCDSPGQSPSLFWDISEKDINVIRHSKDEMLDLSDFNANRSDLPTPSKLITIISYNLASRKDAEFKSAMRCRGRMSSASNKSSNLRGVPGSSVFGTIICDESHALKNATTQRAKCMLPLIQAARRAILLSGTPSNNKPSELHSQIDSLYPGEFLGWKQYTERYCDGQQGRFGWEANGSMNLVELHKLLVRRVMIRRLKRDVLTQLPPKIRSVIEIEIDPSKKRKVNEDVDKAMAEMDSMRTLSQMSIAAEMPSNGDDGDGLIDGGGSMGHSTRAVAAYLSTGVGKVKAVQQYLKDLWENTLSSDPSQKCLVFGHHQAVLDSLESFLRKELKFGPACWIRIDGSVSKDKRQALVDRFQSEKECRFALLSITAAGTGLTLTAAQTVVFAELYWNPSQLLQCEDRAHRISQDGRVTVVYLLAKDSFDDRCLWPRVQSKMTVLSTALEGRAEELTVDEEQRISCKRGGVRQLTLLDWI